MKYAFNIAPEKKYLLVPEMPTPNGRMHLGHIAGPYLKMDLVKRKVQRGNGQAIMVSGSDVYESYVELKSEELGIPEENVCNRFHELIKKDVASLDIQFDYFINPLDIQWNDLFLKREYELMQYLIEAGAVIERDELFPYDTEKQRFINGCWLKGTCPACGYNTGSYLCEICGTHYKPIDIFSKKDYPGAQMVWGKALYLKLDETKLLDQVCKMGIPNAFQKILQDYLQSQGPFVRLTTPQKWGVPWKVGDLDQALFTYSTLWFFSVFCADICFKELGLNCHPFETGSDFVTIASFGIDNAIPYLAAVLGGGISLPGFKPFDYYFPNYFYHLNGEKFSTSRLHVIWSSDIVDISNVQADAVRYYLVKQNPEFAVENFDVTDFINTINNDLFTEYNKAIAGAFERLITHKEYPVDMNGIHLLEKLLVEQNAYVEPPVFNFSCFLEPIQKWVAWYMHLHDGDKTAHCYWWLKGFALLSFPVMPATSQSIWNALSSTMEIKHSIFFESCKVAAPFPELPLFNEISSSDIEKCLPEKCKAARA